MGVLLTDGRYVLAVPGLAGLLPAALVLWGSVLGWLHPLANSELYSGSLILLLGLAVIPQFGSAFGVWTGIGYVVGDFLLSGHPSASESCFTCGGDLITTILDVRVPMLLSYVLLFGLIVFVPFLAKSLASLTLARIPRHEIVTVGVRPVLQGLVQGALAVAWTNAYPPLIRPIFTWRGAFPELDAIRSVQVDGGAVVAIAVAGGIAGPLLEWLALRLRPSRMGAGLTPIVGARARRSGVPLAVKAVVYAAFMTFLMAGLIGSPPEAVLLFAVFAASVLVRRFLQRAPVYTRVVGLIPIVARLLVSAAASYLIGNWILELLRDNQTFFPVVLSIAASVLLTAFLLPSTPPEAAAKPVPPPASAPRIAPPPEGATS